MRYKGTMAEVLLQNNQDDPQSRVSESVSRIIKYDFRRPNKFGKDQMRTLHVIHEYYARMLTTYFSGILRTNSHADVAGVVEKIYHEFSNSLPDPVILAVIEMAPYNGYILIELSQSVAFELLDYILGGIGGEMKENREYTEIEIALLERILSPMTRLIAESWSGVEMIEPRFDRIVTSSRFIQAMSPNETIACITLNVRVGVIKGYINICIPHSCIQPFEDKLSNRFWFSDSNNKVTEEDRTGIILKQLKGSLLEVKAVLGETTITAREVLELQPGDVIQLNSKIRDPMRIMVGGTEKYYGVPGLKNNRMAVRITGCIDEEAKK